MIRTLWNRLGSALRPRQRTQTKPKPVRWRPRFDVLEDRVVPDTTLFTNLLDYAPGSDVTFYGSGYGVGETIDFTIVGDNGNTDAFSITDGGQGDQDGVADGNFVTVWNVGYNYINATLTATATGQDSGASATAVFTDAGAAGTLQAPTGQSPTGQAFNPKKWAVLDGDTITGTITGATDAYVVSGTVQVLIKSTEHGNTQVAGSYSGGTITFTWTVEAPGGHEICGTLVVAYQTGVTGGGQAKFENVNSSGPNGFAVVNADGTLKDDCGGGGTVFSISGIKFFDANGSGAYESGTDGVIAGWTIYLDDDDDFTNGFITSTTTDGFGAYSFIGLAAGTYFVYEGAAPSTGWFQTMGGGTVVNGDPAPATALGGTGGAYAVTLSLANPTSTGNDFGNLKEVGGTGGKTLGFWTNKNGQTVIFDGGTAVPELTLLNSLNLVTTSGGVQDFELTPTGTTGYSQLRTWLLNANAVNMAYMLSAQLAANALAVEAGLLSSTTFVNAYTHLIAFQSQINATAGLQDGGLSNLGYISIRDLQKAADAALAADGLTLAGDPLRAYQEALKTVLDLINNNLLNFIGAC